MEAALNVNEHGSVFMEGSTLIVDSIDSQVKAKLQSNHIKSLLVSLYEAGYLTLEIAKEIEEGEY